MQRLLFSCFFCFVFLSLSAQILAPEFKCVKNDTLKWDLPNNTCGAFQSYRIFVSKNKTGPYSLLQTITNPAQTGYYHQHPPTEVWYYFMQSQFNCVGEATLSSDTLDNLLPEVPEIESVNIVNNKAVVTWKASTSPEVFAYIVYKVTNLGTVPIDTIFGKLSFTDDKSTPTTKSESYYVISMDKCSNTSVFDKVKRSSYLKYKVNSCQRTVDLTWNKYINAKDGVEKQEIWASINNATDKRIATLNGTDTSYTHTGLSNKDKLCFFVKIFHKNTATTAESNRLCFTVNITTPIDYILLKNATVTSNNEVELTWIWNDNAQIDTAYVLSSTTGITYNKIFNFNPPKPALAENTYLDKSAKPDAGKLFYQIKTFDVCDSIRFSPYNTTIFLQGQSNSTNRTNQLKWTAFDTPPGSLTSYDVYKIVDGTETKVATNFSDTTHLDKINAAIDGEANACYYIVATGVVSLSNGATQTVKSRSNQICLVQTPDIFVPNAFVPRGINQEFKPVITFGAMSEYYMVIYDRFGAKLFESTSPDLGWNGRKGERDMEQGVYTYYIRVKQPKDDKAVEVKGVVMLVR